MTNTTKPLQTSAQASTSNGTALMPFWNAACAVKNSSLWFPTKIDLQEQVTNSSNGSSNVLVENLSPLIKQMKSLNSTTITSYPTSQFSVTPITENKIATVTKKIRIYPQNKQKFKELCDLHRACYNKSISIISVVPEKKEDRRKDTDMRRDVMAYCKDWDNYQSHVMQEAFRHATKTREDIINKRKQGQKCDYRYKSRREPIQDFYIQKLPKSGIYPKYTGKTYFTEQIPDYAYGKTAHVRCENGEWYLLCYDLMELTPSVSNGKVCALDPGIRKFQTLYSEDTISMIGDKFYAKKIYPLLLKLDGWISLRDLFKNKHKKLDNQWYYDKLRYYAKKINKLRAKIQHLVIDLHHQTAYYLVQNFDIIMIPKFEVSNMVVKGKRKLNNKSVRGMYGLSHYKFRQTLDWYCQKYNKVMVIVGEEYTSKTNPFTGTLMNIGSSESFVYNGNSYDRDINGSRNIFIKNVV